MPTSASKPTAGESGSQSAQEAPAAEPTVAETNFPKPVPEVEEDAVEEEAPFEGEPSEIWAFWVGQQPSERGLTVNDLQALGDSEATEPIWWNARNRFKVNVTDVHPMVLDYMENDDSGFEIKRY